MTPEPPAWFWLAWGIGYLIFVGFSGLVLYRILLISDGF